MMKILDEDYDLGGVDETCYLKCPECGAEVFVVPNEIKRCMCGAGFKSRLVVTQYSEGEDDKGEG